MTRVDQIARALTYATGVTVGGIVAFAVGVAIGTVLYRLVAGFL